MAAPSARELGPSRGGPRPAQVSVDDGTTPIEAAPIARAKGTKHTTSRRTEPAIKDLDRHSWWGFAGPVCYGTNVG